MEYEAAVLASDQRPVRPALRSNVSVTDWNRDGRPDLLVGDFTQQRKPEPVRSEEQRGQTMHGFVWVYLRTQSVQAAAASAPR